MERAGRKDQAGNYMIHDIVLLPFDGIYIVEERGGFSRGHEQKEID